MYIWGHKIYELRFDNNFNNIASRQPYILVAISTL